VAERVSFIKFLGTAGARFVMIRQLRSSGGIWIRSKATNIIIDPGPGALVRCLRSRPRLDPTSLDAVLLTHKHIDHSNDINVMVEAMTEGGFRKRGILYVPEDALGEEGVVFSYIKDYVEKVVVLKEGDYSVGDIRFVVPVKNIHSVETYGFKFLLGHTIVSLISDTKYFDELAKVHAGSHILILNVVFFSPRDEYPHLSLPEAIDLIEKISPQRAIITHFGMSMLKEKPHLLQEKIRKETGREITFAHDGLTLEITP